MDFDSNGSKPDDENVSKSPEATKNDVVGLFTLTKIACDVSYKIVVFSAVNTVLETSLILLVSVGIWVEGKVLRGKNTKHRKYELEMTGVLVPG